MKKLVCLFLVICISLSSFAKSSGRRYVPALDNSSVVKAQKEQRRSVRSFGSGRRYTAVTRGHGLHLFRRRASRPESGL